MRSNINVNSSIKLFEVYKDFVGGLNTQTSNDNLKDNETTTFENFDLLSGGSMHKRMGYQTLSAGATALQLTGTGQGSQGIFRFKHDDGMISLIVAFEGKLYAMGDGTTMKTSGIVDISAASGGWTFQSTLPIDAVQYQNAMYFATGSRLGVLTYSSGFTIADVAETTISPYQATYLGYNLYNSYANFLSQWTNTTSANAFKVSIVSLGINYTPAPTLGTAMTVPVTGTSSSRAPAVGDRVTFLATYTCDATYVTTAPQYQWEIKRGTDQNFTVMKAYGTDNFLDYQFDGIDDYDIRVIIKLTAGAKSGQTTSACLTSFKILASPDQNTLVTGSLKNDIQKCRRCIIHFNRLFLYYGDLDSSPTTPNRVFVSEFNNFGYFPTFAFIDVISDASQPITNITRIRNELVTFTPSSIYVITGNDFDNTAVYQINDQVGTWHGWSPTVVGNNILFAGNDNIYALQPNQYLLNNYNVAPIGTQILNKYRDLGGTVAKYNRFYGCYYNNQYYLAVRHQSGFNQTANTTNLLKYLPQEKAWSIDKIDSTNTFNVGTYSGVCGMLVDGDSLYAINNTVGATSLATLAQYTASDDTNNASNYYDLYNRPIVSTIATKFFDLSAAYNYKKLKRLYVLLKHFDTTTRLYVTITADANVALDPTTQTVQQFTDATTNAVTWNIVTTTAPNIVDQGSMILATGLLDASLLGEFPVSSYKTGIRAKARRINIQFVHSDATPMEIYGFGFEFREKRP